MPFLQGKNLFLLNAPQRRVFACIVAVKVAVMLLFSSDFQDRLFIPFVQYYLTHSGNPWQHFHTIQVDMFPYPPLMLYLMSLASLPAELLSAGAVVWNLFFKIPTLAADIVIAIVLLRLFPLRFREVMLFYFVSPIILYASYMHSQLDLIPMAVLALSVYSLAKNRVLFAAVILGLAMSIKFHVAAALPLMVIYVYRNHRKASVLTVATVPLAVYLLCSLPYLASEGYIAMVLRNPKQMKLFDAAFAIGDIKIYLPVFAVFALYARFAAYPKINIDLLYSFLGMLFSTFVLLILPSPAWYVWMFPFLSIFFIQYYRPRQAPVLALYWTLSGLYLLYFLFFHIPEYPDLLFAGQPVLRKVQDEKLRNIVYSALEVVLFATIYSLYKFGVRSNAVYRQSHNILVGIGGDSASGKSTLLSDIKDLFGKRLLELEGDADHRWERGDENWQTFTHLHPKANYLHKQAQDLLALKYGKSIARSEYDHATGRFTSERLIEPRDLIVISGLHPFYLPISRKVIDIKIYMDTEEILRRHWKVSRDMHARGYDKNEVAKQIERRMEDAGRFIHPQREYADLIVAYCTKDGHDEVAPDTDPQLRLTITLGSSLHVERLIRSLGEAQVEVMWDYSDDLKNQILVLNTPPGAGVVEAIANKIIPNMRELIPEQTSWQEGYRGFVQMIVLFVLSETIRETSRDNEI